jgi:methionyl-tRNA synthetase
MIYKNLDGILPKPGETFDDRELLDGVATAVSTEIPEAFEALAFSQGIEAWIKQVFACNAYVDAQAPWALRKTDPERMAAVLGTLVVAVTALTEAITPIIPASAEKLLAVIVSGKDGNPIPQPTPLFPRLELEDEEAAA